MFMDQEDLYKKKIEKLEIELADSIRAAAIKEQWLKTEIEVIRKQAR